jgi:hypothetical protein
MPPPLTPQGQAVKPEPEQTFLQKYWMYIAGALLVMSKDFILWPYPLIPVHDLFFSLHGLVLAPSPPEESERAGQSGVAAPRR